MDPLFRPRTRTPVSIPDFLSAVGEALGGSASVEGLATLWAQYAIETGRGNSCWNFNLGNKRAVDGERYTELAAAWECGSHIPPGAREIPKPPGGECPAGELYYLPSNQRFAAYDTLLEGAAGYVALLSRPRYQGALMVALKGDAEGFARELKARGYFTADVGPYAAGLKSLKAEALRAAAAMPSLPPGTPPPAPNFDSRHAIDTSGFEPPLPKLSPNDDDPDAGGLGGVIQRIAEAIRSPQDLCNTLACTTAEDATSV